MKRYAMFVLALSALCLTSIAAPVAPDRPTAQKLMRDGNWQEAYDQFRALILSENINPDQVAQDLRGAVQCLQQLGRVDEFDSFVEAAITAHPKTWQLLNQAAWEYVNVDHQGALIAGEFTRGPHRGGTAKYVNAYERDRVRALQLMRQAIESAEDTLASVRASLHQRMAENLMGNRGWYEAWRLQYLTDLTTLPDYEEGYYGYHGYGSRGAPVNADGSPVFYKVSESWEAAQNDGERWRWSLSQVATIDPAQRDWAQHHFAEFLHNQFGVQTLQGAPELYRAMQAGADFGENSGTYALHTLKENETIARLASGAKRFELPDEFNFIRIFQELGEAKRGYAENSLNTLAQIFENRRQYPRAAEYWRASLALSRNDWKQQRLEQIVGNWGMFETVMTQPAGGKGASVEFRFRNGKHIAFEAFEVNVQQLLRDVKAYLKTEPRQLEWEQVNIQDVGRRLVFDNQTKYIGQRVEQWGLDLEPRPNHFDRRITVQTPLTKAGAYLLVGKLENGNTARVVLWVADTVIVKKPMEGTLWCYVGDAVTGAPVTNATVDFFCYRQEWVENRQRGEGRHRIYTTEFAERTDATGQVFAKPPDQRYQTVMTATSPDGRLAYLGFTGAWAPTYRDREYNQQKVFLITDRPVYRPAQTVKFKFWVNQAQYDREGPSPYAGRQMNVQVFNPRNEKIFEKRFTADEFGGIDGEFPLEEEATLGMYGLQIENIGGGGFRVEEYKKPEFEVTVDAPTEPVMLGETIEAKITAKYYFGAPVTEAKVKYKIMRTGYTERWYPWRSWDWLYGAGYWWFAYDYTWYPGWREWGCMRPSPWWWPQRYSPPELVADAELPINADGTVTVTIDTSSAKELFGDVDHRYEITAEVTDQSRRTIVGTGAVLVAREPFKVTGWVDRGYFRAGDTARAHFFAHTLDNKPVKGEGVLRLLKISYDAENKPVETEVQQWELNPNDEGRAEQQFIAAQSGQFRLSYTVTDTKGHSIEGGYIFVVRGEGFDGADYRFNAIELVPDRAEYAPGENVSLMINTERENSTVLLFVRPSNGAYLPPKVLKLDGKSALEAIEVVKKDMPNFFVEALTISDGKVNVEARQIVVPPENRILDVEVTPSAKEYKPGEQAEATVKVTGPDGEPYSGALVVSLYDKAVEYISGGSNVADIKKFFWEWRRHHHPATESSLSRGSSNLLKQDETGMSFIGVFGHMVPEEETMGGAVQWVVDQDSYNGGRRGGMRRQMIFADGAVMAESAAMPAGAPMMTMGKAMAADALGVGGEGGGQMVEPTVRTQFADTAFWGAALRTGVDGMAKITLTMPENLTTWKAKAWAMGGGARVGEGAAEVITTKNLIIRLQAPRFFVQKDEVVLSAIVHNYLETQKEVRVILELDGDTLQLMADQPAEKLIIVDANGEQRVDWRVRAVNPGEAVVRMKALTDEESDAMEMRFPVIIHGILKTESFSGVIRPEQNSSAFTVRVPEERLPEQTRLEIRYSPTLAAAMVDALPYMADYPYGCTEQTLNRFLPAVITQQTLQRMGLDLEEIGRKRTNLNAQEIGEDVERAKQWKRFDRNPVFDMAELNSMVKAGVNRLASMQCADGGWGWFSGWGEYSYPHTTAVVVHGLQVAKANDVALLPDMLERGEQWLKQYQQEELQKLRNWAVQQQPWKEHADNIDAFVYMVLVDGQAENEEMRDFLYRDRNYLSVYAKGMFGLALNTIGDTEKRDMLIRNIEQFLVQDDENQTAYLRMPEGNWWWSWHGSDTEAQAFYLKLLAATDPKGETASRLVKYLINNRKHSTYWNSTRDTAYCIEAFSDFLQASGEEKPDMAVTVLVDGKVHAEVQINSDNLFTFDNKVVMEGSDVTAGEHRVELRRTGAGRLYYNAYLTNFTLEDPITAAGLEIKVNRKFYKLTAVEKTVKVEAVRGQAVDQRVEKYERTELENLDTLKSGDLCEIELTIESKNDYEYIIFEDNKVAGMETMEIRSGYTGNEMGAYVEFRDERTVFFVRVLPRGKHSVSYRLRAEIPGRFSALPTIGSGMYAPELKANSDEFKVQIAD